MNEVLLATASQIIIGVIALMAIITVVIASWYDVRAITQNRTMLIARNKRRMSNQPSILVLIYAHNNESAIIACLQSITMSKYRHYQVVVCDNASSDTTVRLVRAYKRRNKQIRLTLHTTKQQRTRMNLLQTAHDKAKKHDLTLLIDATDIISTTLLTYCVAYFNTNNRLIALRLRRQNIATVTIAALFRQYIDLSLNIIYKATSRYSVSNNPFQSHPVLFRDALIKQSHSLTRRDIAYASSLLVTTSVSANKPQMASKYTVFILLGCLCGIFLMSYFFYTAAMLRSNILLTLSWLLVSLWFLAVVWSDSASGAVKKIELMVTIPFMYFILYVQLVVYAISHGRRLLGAVQIPRIDFKSIQDAIRQETYSIRF